MPSEVQEVITRIGEQISQERYDQIYNESSGRWKQEVTLDKSNKVFKTLRTKLGKVESRSLTYANEQENSGGPLKVMFLYCRIERALNAATRGDFHARGRKWKLVAGALSCELNGSEMKKDFAQRRCRTVFANLL